MDLSTCYLGLKLKSPLVPSACQALTNELDHIKKMEDAGAGAIVLYSLFEEQLKRDAHELDRHTSEFYDSFSEATSFFPEPDQYLLGPDEYLEHIVNAKKTVDIPIIASLNGSTSGGWTKFARQIQDAGADALELNIYSVPVDSDRPGSAIEEDCLAIFKEVRKKISIPIAVKLSPFFTNLSHFAKRLDEAGADALVLFNRFYQPDIDLEELRTKPEINLSSPLTMRLPLRWAALLYGRITADIAITSGIHKGEDALKALMAGAKVTMLCSSILRYGIGHISVVQKGMEEWLDSHGYDDIETLQGSMSQARCEDPANYERVQYVNSLHLFRPHWKK
jgi:dihydroorotate dehydrogenase (fumarate)